MLVPEVNAIEEIELKKGNRYIVCDGSLEDIDPGTWPDLFEPEFIEKNGLATSTAAGRGPVCFFRWGDHKLVLRHYRRGGLLGRSIEDSYLGFSLAGSRPYREWKLLGRLCELGLPVPRPAGIRLTMGMGFYRGDLLTHQVEDAAPLSDRLREAVLEKESWRAVGRTIRRFHDQGAFHRDLNAANILLRDQEVFLLDFDGGAIRKDEGWKEANLDRLGRSLAKRLRLGATFHFSQPDWELLLDGYNTTG